MPLCVRFCCVFFSFSWLRLSASFFFFFNDTATTEIYTLSLHDALPICLAEEIAEVPQREPAAFIDEGGVDHRSEEHTSELQSPDHLVCRLLLEKKKKNIINDRIYQNYCHTTMPICCSILYAHYSHLVLD